MTLSTVEIGLLSSVVSELLKYLPFLNKNELTVAGTAIVVTAIGTWLWSPAGLTMDSLVASLVGALASYKFVVQPIATHMGLKTQA